MGFSIPNIDWTKHLGSKAFENVANVAGTALMAHGQSKDDAANRDAANGANASSLMARLLADEQTRRQNAATGAANAAPLGANENFAARQAMLQQILAGARNVSFTPGDPDVAAAMGTQSGGLRLPEGGLSAASLKHLGPEATASAIASRARMISNIDPTSGTPDFAAMGFDPALAGQYGAQTSSYADTRLKDTTSSDDARRAQIMAALDRDITGAAQGQAKENTPWWKKALKAAAVIAPIAAIPFTFGASAAISPAALGAIGGASSLAGRVGNSPTRRQNPYSGVSFGAK